MLDDGPETYKGQTAFQGYAPTTTRRHILLLLHDSLSASYLAAKKQRTAIWGRFVWHGVQKDLHEQSTPYTTSRAVSV